MTGLRINTRIDDRQVRRALQLAPVTMTRHIDRAVGRAAQVVARSARRNAPKAFSTLTNSIRAQRRSPFRQHVGPGVEYGRMVEEGTGPGGTPPRQTLIDWIRVKGIRPNDPTMTMRDLEFVIGRKIRERGTPAQPYLQPALEENESAVTDLIRRGVERGLYELGLR